MRDLSVDGIKRSVREGWTGAAFCVHAARRLDHPPPEPSPSLLGDALVCCPVQALEEDAVYRVHVQSWGQADPESESCSKDRILGHISSKYS